MSRRVLASLSLLERVLHRLEQLGSEDDAQGITQHGSDGVTDELRALIARKWKGYLDHERTKP